jgi:competence protein ComFC
MYEFITDMYNLILSILFPTHCLLCNKGDTILCLLCTATFTSVTFQRCIACQTISTDGFTHLSCRGPFVPDGCISLFEYYDSSVAHSIVAGKYKFLPDIFKVLGILAGEYLLRKHAHTLLSPAVLTAIPLSGKRQRWRGFNQAEILAKEIAGLTALPYLNLLQKTKHTASQTDLDQAHRITNVRNCFTLREDCDMSGRNIVLVDDVITTGATLREASKVLKQSGAKTVWCVAIARD